MLPRLAACVAIAALTFIAPRPAHAGITKTYDTIDAVDALWSPSQGEVITITGILVGESAPTTTSIQFGQEHDRALHCQRLAVFAMSKPGKVRFGIGPLAGGTGVGVGCRITVVTP